MERVRDWYRPVSRRAEIVRFGFDQRVYALGILGLIRWIEGYPEHSMQQSRTSIDEARTLQHPVSLCIAMWTGCLVSLWVGDLVALGRLTTSLLDHTEKHSLDNYHAYGVGFDGELHALKGDAAAGARLIRFCLDGLRRARHRVFYSVFLGALAKRLSAGGDVAEGLAIVNEALGLAERNHESWYMAELLRIKGEVLLLCRAPVAIEAEDYFLRSLAWARQQGARSWELRAAMSLARLWAVDARNREARELVAPIYDQFTEGFETPDLKQAKGLLEQLG